MEEMMMVRGPGRGVFTWLAEAFGDAWIERPFKNAGVLLVDAERGVGPETSVDVRALRGAVDRVVAVVHAADQVAIHSLEQTCLDLEKLVLRHGYRNVPVLVLPRLVPGHALATRSPDLVSRGVRGALRVLAA